MRQKQGIFSFNRGLISALALAREDIKRVSLAASTFVNFIARVLGSMAFRQGWQYLGSTYANSAARCLPFIFSTTDTAIIELTNAIMRVWVSDTLVTRVSVSTAISNGTFSGNITGWTSSDEAGATSVYAATNTMSLTGTGTNSAIRYQLVTVAGGDQNKEHALRIAITKGFVKLRVGTALHGDSYINEAILGVGTHSLAFTPTGNFYVELKSALTYACLVSNCTIEASGVMTLPTPWLTADLGNVRFDESADIVYLACSGYQQRKIERRGTYSWSIVLYDPQDGPFRIENVSPTTLAPSALNGNITVTASAPLFYSTHVGALFSISSIGQTVSKTAGALNDVTTSVRVTGIGASRALTIIITSLTATGDTVILQQSFDNASWTDVAGEGWVGDVTTSYNDTLDNQIIYYRLKCSVYAAGSPVMKLSFPSGTIYGIIKITAFSSSTSVSASVLSDLGSTTASDTWEEGAWSDLRGWPTSIRFHEGRLWFFGKGGVFGSVSDAYASFDENTLGDSGPLNRSIGSGPVDTINWGISTQVLLIGSQGAEISIQSSTLGDPLTPTSFNIKTISTQGSAAVEAVKIDQFGIFVQRGGIRVYQATSVLNPYALPIPPVDLTSLVPELGLPGIVRMAVQRQPDTRLHCVRSDGTVMLGIFDSIENVLCWSEITTDGLIEDVVVLPGLNGVTEDKIYYIVNRTINGATVRYLEKWALETECRGGTLNKQADSFVSGTQAASTSISGLTNLIGKSVVCWHDGICEADTDGSIKTFTVSGGGTITVGSAATSYVVGLPYTAQWQSTKLGEATGQAPALGTKKNMAGLGLICAYFHPKGLQYGNSFTDLRDMPSVEAGAVINQNTIRTAYDAPPLMLGGGWTTDNRLCLQALAPRPVTVMAAVADSEVSQ